MDKNLYLGNKDAAEYVGVNAPTFFGWVHKGTLKIPYRRGISVGHSHENKRSGKLYRVRDLDIVKESMEYAKRHNIRFYPSTVMFGDAPVGVTQTPINLMPDPLQGIKPAEKADLKVEISSLIDMDKIASEVTAKLVEPDSVHNSILKKYIQDQIKEYLDTSYRFHRRVVDIMIESLKNDISTINVVEKAVGMKGIRIYLIIQSVAMCLMAFALLFGGK